MDELYRLGKNHGKPHQLNYKDIDEAAIPPYIIVSEGESIHDLEYLLPDPIRGKGEYLFDDLVSFQSYVSKNLTPNTTIWVSGNLVCAIINDHHDGINGWQDWVCYVWYKWDGDAHKELANIFKNKPVYKGMPAHVIPPVQLYKNKPTQITRIWKIIKIIINYNRLSNPIKLFLSLKPSLPQTLRQWLQRKRQSKESKRHT